MDADLTIPEAAALLRPAMNERQLTMIIAALGLTRTGSRHTGRDGRPRPTYAATDIMRLHQALLPWLTVSVQ